MALRKKAVFPDISDNINDIGSLEVTGNGPNPQEWGYTNPPGKLTPPPGPPEQGGRPNGAEESKMYLKHYLQ